jgi:ankyrin repeat protein
MEIFDAVQNGKMDQLRAFVQGGGDINVRGKGNLDRSLLHSAIEFNHPEMAEFIVSVGASVSAKDYRGKTPLHYAAGMGLLSLVELLIEKGADPKSLDVFGENALHHISSGGGSSPEEDQVAIVRRLIAVGLNVDSVGNAKRTPLYYAAGRGKLSVTKELLDAGADASKAAAGQLGTPIDAASEAGHPAVAALLKGRGPANR